MSDPDVLLWWVVFSIFVVGTISLCILGFVLRLGSDGSFRAFVSSALLFYLALGMLTGWGVATAICFVGLWICAVVASALRIPGITEG